MHRNILCAPGDQKKQTKEQEELTQKEHRTGRYPGSAQIMHLPTLLPITNYRFLMLGQATNTLYQWTRLCMCMRAKSLQSFPTLCNPLDYSLSGSSVHGILQVRILEWVVMPSSRGIFPTQGSNSHLMSSALAGRFFTTSTTWEAQNR